jgi:hypothetical protein
MSFILGIGVGILLTMGYAFLSVASDADDVIDNRNNFR